MRGIAKDFHYKKQIFLHLVWPTQIVIALLILFFLVTLFRVGFLLSITYLMVANLAWFRILILRSQLGPSIESSSFPSAGLQVVEQSTHLLKDCYP